MLFEDTTLLLLWFACTYAIVQITLGLQQGLKATADELDKQLADHIDSLIHMVEVEQHNEVYYWYDKDNKNFLAQGRTTEEIIDTLKSRFPAHIFYFEKSNHLICAQHNWEPHPVKLTKKP